MTPSPPTDHSSDTRHSNWFVAGNPHARAASLDSQPDAPPILARTVQPATSPLRARQYFAADRSPHPLRSNLLQSHPAAKSP
jgi:hypothetical protein